MWYFILYIIFGAWVYKDAASRRGNAIPWAIGTAVLGPLVIPFYLAKRPLKSGEVREGGTAWNVLRNYALFWTITMAAFAVWMMIFTGRQMSGEYNEYRQAGMAIGASLGLGMIGLMWFFPTVGAIALGFFLKKSSIVERGPTGLLASSAGVSSGATSQQSEQIFCSQCGAKNKKENTFCSDCGQKMNQGS